MQHWDEPSEEQLRELLERATDMAEPEIERTVALYSRRRVVRWAPLDREFARRALARQARRVKR